MLLKLLGNRFIGIFGIVLSLLVFNIGIAVPLSTMAINNLAVNSNNIAKAFDISDDLSDTENNTPIEEEEESQRAPIPGSEEEDEKSKEMFDPWELIGSTSLKKEVVLETYRLPHLPFEVSTPPPEV